MAQADEAAFGSRRTGSRGVLSRVARRWRSILLCWIATSALIVWAAYVLVRPVYKATAVFTAGSSPPIGYHLEELTPGTDASAWMNTEMAAVRSDRVLGRVLARREIGDRPRFKNSSDPASDLRRDLNVRMLPGTHIVEVSLESEDPGECAAIVNAVLETYLNRRNEHTETELADGLRRLDARLKELQAKIEALHRERLELLDRDRAALKTTAGGSQDLPNLDGASAAGSSFASLGPEEDRKLREELLATELQIIQARAELDARTGELVDVETTGRQAEAERALVTGEFRRDPLVNDLIRSVKATRKQVEELKASKPKDAATLSGAEAKLHDMEESYADYWADRSEEIRLRLQAEATRGLKAAIGSLSARLAGLEAARRTLVSLIGRSQKDQEKSREQAARAASLAQQIDSFGRIHAEALAARVRLEQAEFDITRSASDVYWAELPRAPVRHIGPTPTLLSPFAALFLVLMPFLLFVSRPRSRRPSKGQAIEEPTGD